MKRTALAHRAGIIGAAVVGAALIATTASPAAAAGTTVSPAAAAGTAAGTGVNRHGKPSIQVIATGLNNPRGVVLGRAGTVLVAEAGTGGSGPCVTSPEGGEACFGLSGSITLVGFGKQRRIVTGLPSIADKGTGESALGPHKLAITPGGRLIATIGLGGPPESRALFGPPGRPLATVRQLLPFQRKIADLAKFEAANNPDAADPGSALDTNPYGLAWTSRFGLVATDAGGNDVLAIDRHGHVRLLAVLHTRQVPAPPGFPAPTIDMQAVPTAVRQGPDGALYVGQLTGFPFPVGGANVWRIVPGHAPTVFAGGFTNIVDIAFDRRGRLYVLEIAKNGLLSGDPVGALIRVDRDGHRTEIAAGQLVAPGGLAIAPNGTIYVSTFSVAAGGGQLVRIRP